MDNQKETRTGSIVEVGTTHVQYTAVHVEAELKQKLETAAQQESNTSCHRRFLPPSLQKEKEDKHIYYSRHNIK